MFDLGLNSKISCVRTRDNKLAVSYRKGKSTEVGVLEIRHNLREKRAKVTVKSGGTYPCQLSLGGLDSANESVLGWDLMPSKLVRICDSEVHNLLHTRFGRINEETVCILCNFLT